MFLHQKCSHSPSKIFWWPPQNITLQQGRPSPWGNDAFPSVSEFPLFWKKFSDSGEKFPNVTFSKQISPLFLKNSPVFYILYVHFIFPRFDHDAFMYHTMHVLDAPALQAILKRNFHQKFSDDFFLVIVCQQKFLSTQFFGKMFWSPGVLYILTVSLEKVPEGACMPWFIIWYCNTSKQNIYHNNLALWLPA